eukprot:GHVR01161198.1.p1 GENE.GHVR01161198.1~~GHVR01161198.1.p1  ORF type:complete len:107 (+),score=32.12 GHVR01161198.1:100-420(+)
MEMIARASKSGTQMESILHPSNGYRGELERRGICPKDHIKENRRLIRLQESQNIQRREGEVPKKPFVMSRFKNAKSVIKSTGVCVCGQSSSCQDICIDNNNNNSNY